MKVVLLIRAIGIWMRCSHPIYAEGQKYGEEVVIQSPQEFDLPISQNKRSSGDHPVH